MANTINASTTSTSGLVQTADASGILQLQSDGITGLTVGNTGNVTVNTNLFVSGAEVEPLVLGTAQTTTSGTSVNFTGIPTWVKRVTLLFAGISTNSTSGIIVRLSSGGVFASSGYVSVTDAMGTSVAPNSRTDGFTLGDATITAAESYQGTYTFTTLGNNIWVGTLLGSGSFPLVLTGGGYIALGGLLDGIRLTTITGTSTFDAGTVNIMYE